MTIAGHLILLHGHDDDPVAFAAHATALAPVGWTSSAPVGPVPTANGASWFRAGDDGAPDPDDVHAALAQLDEATVTAAAGLGAGGRLVLAGFSQGAALALLHLVKATAPAVHLDALVALAGWLPSVDGIDLDLPATASRAGHVLVAHGADDEVVPLPLGRSVFRLLERQGAAATFIDRPLGHVLAPFAEPVRAWIAELDESP